jgi:hypothetical protein
MKFRIPSRLFWGSYHYIMYTGDSTLLSSERYFSFMNKMDSPYFFLNYLFTGLCPEPGVQLVEPYHMALSFIENWRNKFPSCWVKEVGSIREEIPQAFQGCWKDAEWAKNMNALQGCFHYSRLIHKSKNISILKRRWL